MWGPTILLTVFKTLPEKVKGVSFLNLNINKKDRKLSFDPYDK